MKVIKNISKMRGLWIQKYFWWIVAIWTILMVLFLVQDLIKLKNITQNLALKEARTHFQEDEAFRLWATTHGGFYVVVDSTTPPNPYLSNIPDRDIETPSGVKLTLMNPAYAQRQMLEAFHSNYGVGGHITSLRPLRPENAPDQWEHKALESFESGTSEVVEFRYSDSVPMLRFMKPLITKQGCLKCHGSQGYKVGDIRGGVSISIPLNNDYLVEKKCSATHQAMSTAFIWLLGFFGLFQGYRVITRKEAEKGRALYMLRKSHKELESRICERTDELRARNEQLKEEIIERERMDKSLNVSEERYQGVVQNMASCMAVYKAVDKGKDFVFVDFNKKAEEIEHISKQDVLGKKVTEIFPGIEKFGLLKLFQEVYNDGVPRRFPLSIYQDRRIKGHRENYVYKLSSGEIVAIYDDMSEAKRYEQIQKILYNISNAVTTTGNVEDLIDSIRTELDVVIDTTNFYVAFYEKDTDMLLLPYYADENDKFTRAPAAKTLTKYVIDTQKPLLVDNQLKREFEKKGLLLIQGKESKQWLGAPLKIDGKVYGVFAVQSYTNDDAYNEKDLRLFEFVSEQISLSIHRKQVEEDLKTALKKATESDQLKTAFLHNISHEIRTPMNGILGFARLLRGNKLTEEEKESYVDIITKSGERMLSTINDLLDISMIESGQVKIDLSEMDVNSQMKNLFSFFKLEVERKGMKLILDETLPNESSLIKTDKDKVVAVLSNLIKNAIKYSQAGSIKFSCKVVDNQLKCCVKDTGIGIPKNRQQAIFKRFVQADIEDSQGFEGSGLGLSISKAYVEMLGGEIWVKSEVNTGSVFCFTIPYNPVKHVSDNTDLQPDKASFSSKKKLKVILAEDDKVSLSYLEIVLNNIGSRVLFATSGKEVVELCKNHPDADLILMDIKMPGMNGYEATMKIREFNKKVKIIAQTAYAQKGDDLKATDAGCDAYISKPINQEELVEIINQLL